MVFKPMSPQVFNGYLKMVGWRLDKGSIDWKLYDENGAFICAIIISHGSRTKSEVVASSVRKVEQAFKEKGLKWPPQKKLKKS